MARPVMCGRTCHMAKGSSGLTPSLPEGSSRDREGKVENQLTEDEVIYWRIVTGSQIPNLYRKRQDSKAEGFDCMFLMPYQYTPGTPVD